jgi:hypothetical protein
MFIPVIGAKIYSRNPVDFENILVFALTDYFKFLNLPKQLIFLRINEPCLLLDA